MNRPPERLVVVGDALLDRDLDGRVERLCPDAPVPVVDDPVARARPGGAGLAALLAAADGLEVVLVTALADDEPGHELGGLLASADVDLVVVPLYGPTPQKVRVRADGRTLLRLDHGARRAPVGSLPAAARRALSSDAAAAVLVSDYGRGLSADPGVRSTLAALAARRPVVWDPHPRGAEPVGGVRLATPNRAEAAALVPAVADDRPARARAAPHAPPAGGDLTRVRAAPQAPPAGGDLTRVRAAPQAPPAGGEISEIAARARALVRRWRAGGVAVTLGSRGALLAAADGTTLMVPAASLTGADPCGAGDRFAARAATGLARGQLLTEAVIDAVAAATAFVAAGGAASVHPDAADAPRAAGDAPAGPPDPLALVRRVRARGGTVVATGGCFDLLHAGHVRTLEAARGLGDCLVVCLNSDASVRRLKGPDRPLVPQADRAAVLQGLACVDAVAVFDEDTPEATLNRLRPDVWAKGADYAVADLPEADLVASWGGQTLVLPYLPGRSTTRLIQEAIRHDRI